MTPPSSAAAAGPKGPAQVFSAGGTIAASYRFLFGHAGAIVQAVWLSVVLAAGVLLLAFEVYFSMLARYLASPNADFASVTVSATIAGYFVWLLPIAVGTARLMQLVEGDGPRGWLDPRGMRLAARLYTAVLRFQLLLVMGAAALLWLVLLGADLLPVRPSGLRTLISVPAIFLFAAVLSVRCGLLIPALAFHERRSVLRRGWKLSRGAFWPLFAVWAVVAALPVVLLQVLGEVAIRDLVADPGMTTLATAAAKLASDHVALAMIAVTVTVTSTLFAALTTIASAQAYRTLGARR